MTEPEKHFKKVWGTAFTGATLSHKNGLLELSMEHIYETMQSFADKEVKKALIRNGAIDKQLLCDCNKWHDRMEESNNNCSTCDKPIK